MPHSHHAVTALGPITLTSGEKLPEVEVAYAHYGSLASDGRNAILVCHGYTSNHRMLAHGSGVAEGSWAGLIGPGLPLDTDKFFIICCNMLGSCYGSTGPSSLNTLTGQPYGVDFPAIKVADMVNVQRLLLQKLGVSHLRAVLGPSFGGFLALQWAISYPDEVDAIGVVLSAPSLPRNNYTSMEALLAVFDRDPAWNGGHGATREAVYDTLRQLRLDTMTSYGAEAVLAAQGVPPSERDCKMEKQAAAWAREFDPHSLFVLLEAALEFDARPHLAKIYADVLYVNSDTDLLFPPNPDVLIDLSRTLSKRPLIYVPLRTELGHMASGAEHKLWSGALAQLLTFERLDEPLSTH
jgi:homoserine O-acetyltransferase